LLSPRTNDTTANEYVASDSANAVVFAFRHSQEYNTLAPVVYLRGLGGHSVYRVESIDGKLAGGTAEYSGAYLMQNGLQLVLKGDFDSTAVLLHRVR
jgi:alpha-galactosidase